MFQTLVIMKREKQRNKKGKRHKNRKIAHKIFRKRRKGERAAAPAADKKPDRCKRNQVGIILQIFGNLLRRAGKDIGNFSSEAVVYKSEIGNNQQISRKQEYQGASHNPVSRFGAFGLNAAYRGSCVSAYKHKKRGYEFGKVRKTAVRQDIYSHKAAKGRNTHKIHNGG